MAFPTTLSVCPECNNLSHPEVARTLIDIYNKICDIEARVGITGSAVTTTHAYKIADLIARVVVLETP